MFHAGQRLGSASPFRWVRLRSPDAQPVVPGLGATLRLVGLLVVLGAAPSQRVAAQAIGTMQVSASVLRASASWAGLDEAARATRVLLRSGSWMVRRSGMVLTSAALARTADGRRSLLVTIQHPYN